MQVIASNVMYCLRVVAHSHLRSVKMKPPSLRLSYYVKFTQIGMELWVRMHFHSDSKSLIVNKTNQLFPMMASKNPIHAMKKLFNLLYVTPP